MAAAVDEASIDHPDPVENVLQTARLKAQTIYERFLKEGRLPQGESERVIIIAADTTVTLDGQMLGKPANTADATRMLRALRGRWHEVHTGMALVVLETGEEATAVHTAYVTMRPYSAQEIDDYVASGDPMDKAGAYAIQNALFRPVESLEGCYLGVMGLTVCQLQQLLDRLNVPAVADPEELAAAHGHYTCPLFQNWMLDHN